MLNTLHNQHIGTTTMGTSKFYRKSFKKTSPDRAYFAEVHASPQRTKGGETAALEHEKKNTKKAKNVCSATVGHRNMCAFRYVM